MDFALPAALESLRLRVRAFIDERVIPAEQQVLGEAHDGSLATLTDLQQHARDQGLWVPHLSPELGGLGLGVMGMCALFREMGRSLVGPRCFNCDAPDQGNMDLLAAHASPIIRQRWLQPLAQARITSAFCMTEPPPGAGSDPGNLSTTARRSGPAETDGWVIDGHKWYSTGGRDAAFLIVMARTSDDPRTGASMFVVDRHAPGIEHVRDVPTMAPGLLQHHEAELRFHAVKVGPDHVLGKVGDGFALAQARLIPARLTHCMRWLGLADRALQMCRAYVSTRTSFGRVLARHQQVQVMIARNATDIHAGNLMTWHCASLLAAGRSREAKTFSSMTKTHVARTLCRVLDDAIQIHGGLGYSEDMPFSLWYRIARAARIADGPDEVHQVVVARDFLLSRIDLLGGQPPGGSDPS